MKALSLSHMVRKEKLNMADIRIARAMWMDGSGTKTISLALYKTNEHD